MGPVNYKTPGEHQIILRTPDVELLTGSHKVWTTCKEVDSRQSPSVIVHSSSHCFSQMKYFYFCFYLPFPLLCPNSLCRADFSHTHSALIFQVNFRYCFGFSPTIICSREEGPRTLLIAQPFLKELLSNNKKGLEHPPLLLVCMFLPK